MTRYSPRVPHVKHYRVPTPADVLAWPRFVRREEHWSDNWECEVWDVRYSPDSSIAVVFVYPAALTVDVDARAGVA